MFLGHCCCCKPLGLSQGNQGYSGYQKNAIQRQRPDIENRHTKEIKQSKVLYISNDSYVERFCMVIRVSVWLL